MLSVNLIHFITKNTTHFITHLLIFYHIYALGGAATTHNMHDKLTSMKTLFGKIKVNHEETVETFFYDMTL